MGFTSLHPIMKNYFNVMPFSPYIKLALLSLYYIIVSLERVLCGINKKGPKWAYGKGSYVVSIERALCGVNRKGLMWCQ